MWTDMDMEPFACSAGCITGLTRLICMTRQVGLTHVDDIDTRLRMLQSYSQVAALPVRAWDSCLLLTSMPEGQQLASSCQISINRVSTEHDRKQLHCCCSLSPILTLQR